MSPLLKCALSLFVFSLSTRALAMEASPLPPKLRPPAITVWTGGGVGSVFDTRVGPIPAAQGTLGVTVPLGRLFAVELSGAGAIAKGRGSEPDDAWGRLALGLRVERGDLWKMRPYGAVRLIHVHFAPLDTWTDHPGASLAGSSSHGLSHRSGLAAAIGLSYGLGDSRFRLYGELEPSWLAVGRGPSFFATASFGMGVTL